MQYLHLDTSHLIKWHNKTLVLAAEEKLNALISTNDAYIVISDIHINELTYYEDQAHVLNIFEFLSTKPCAQILPNLDFYTLEITNAYNIFCNKTPNEEPFIKPVDKIFFNEENIKENLIGYQKQTVLHQSHNNQILKSVPIMKEISHRLPQKDAYRKQTHEAFKERIKAAINYANLTLSSDTEKNFVKFLTKNINLIPALTINLYCYASWHRNADSKKVTINDWFDILHLNAAPYVDQFFSDRETHTRFKNTLTSTKLSLDTYIDYDLRNLKN